MYQQLATNQPESRLEGTPQGRMNQQQDSALNNEIQQQQPFNFVDVQDNMAHDQDALVQWQMNNNNKNLGNYNSHPPNDRTVSGNMNSNNSNTSMNMNSQRSLSINDSISVDHLNMSQNVIPQQQTFQYTGNPMKQQQQMNMGLSSAQPAKYNMNNKKGQHTVMEMSRNGTSTPHIPAEALRQQQPYPQQAQNPMKTSQATNKLKRQYSKNKVIPETSVNNFQTQSGFSGHRAKIPTPINVGPQNPYSGNTSATAANNNNNNNMVGTPSNSMNITSPFRNSGESSVTTFPFAIRKYLANMAAIKFHDMIDMINLSVGRITQPSYWQKCMKEVFTPDAIIRYSKTSTTEVRQFDFLVPLVPILFVTLGRLGVVRIEVLAQQLKTELISDGTIFFDCPRCTFTYHYPDGSYITHFVQLKGLFNSALKIKWGDLHMHSFVPGIEWNSLERLVSNNFGTFDIFKKLSGGDLDSTNIKKEEDLVKSEIDDENSDKNINSKDYKSGQAQDDASGNSNPTGSLPPNFEAITQLRSHFSVFRNVSVFGSQEGLMRVMQVSTVMSSLKNLWMYQRLHKIDSPLAAMQQYVERYKQDIKGPTVLQNRHFQQQQQQQQQQRQQQQQQQQQPNLRNTASSQEREATTFNQPHLINNGNSKLSMTPIDSMSPFSQENIKPSSSSAPSSEKIQPLKKRRTSCISPRSRGTPSSVPSSYDYSLKE
ncbi:similar to Kazachstania africana KAFR_0F00210 hypothetical protein [Maudiozyma saulgeensis]|uniref:Morphogenetic regulator of filamentous growth protein 1 n=1 Tax=Maudiozyma saulgeensis TaxID=1789683 RepID=A0A1X7R6W4_9SACH|nr:similar to Kazachstania africana KAFR_0F00210 hypothetical protein [Kazachstania saulgeensis]